MVVSVFVRVKYSSVSNLVRDSANNPNHGVGLSLEIVKDFEKPRRGVCSLSFTDSGLRQSVSKLPRSICWSNPCCGQIQTVSYEKASKTENSSKKRVNICWIIFTKEGVSKIYIYIYIYLPKKTIPHSSSANFSPQTRERRRVESGDNLQHFEHGKVQRQIVQYDYWLWQCYKFHCTRKYWQASVNNWETPKALQSCMG